VALIILATNEPVERLVRILGWLRHRWPSCPLMVVGDGGHNEYEAAARQGGAYYLTRPVAPAQWADMIAHVATQAEVSTQKETKA
jgi:DNA-binding response OmpR family regulator